MKIGFIGLGHMGLPMAMNLLKHGYEVTGYDLEPQQLGLLKAAGGQISSNIKAIAEETEIIITMLQTGKQVKAVCLGDEGLFSVVQNLKLFIDCSSIDVETSKIINEEAVRRNILAIDAPVSGGVVGAKAATLTFMVGGSEEGYEIAKPILNLMGKHVIHTGDAGSGQAAKICNNMILGISMVAISEGLILGEKLGLEPKKLHEVVTKSSGKCWAMSHYVPLPDILENVPANHNYQPGFTVAMMLKDLNLSQESAKSVDFNTSLAAVATKIYQKFSDQHHENLDFSAIIKLVEQNLA